MFLPKQTRPIRLRVPVEMREEVGLGDIIRRATSALGIKHCGGCEQRAQLLNKQLVFTGRKRR